MRYREKDGNSLVKPNKGEGGLVPPNPAFGGTRGGNENLSQYDPEE